MGTDTRSTRRTLALAGRRKGDLEARRHRWGCQRWSQSHMMGRCEIDNGLWSKEALCASQNTMRYGSRGIPKSAFAAHDVSIAPRRGAFTSVSTISISPPHSGQVGSGQVG
jgi:hypothetical protein